MNSIYILVFSALWLIIAYFWYGKRVLQKKLVEPLDENPCPSHASNDGVDFYPAPSLVLFGHHFSSIAGAGPIVGPIVAVTFFGWGPAVIWLLVAGVFVGAVHDYLSLIISVRHNGVSIPETAEKYVSKKARILFLIFVWLTIILVVAVFGNLAAKAMIAKPELVLPTFLIIPLAIVFGMINKNGLLPLWANTAIALAGLIFLIWLGFQYPVNLPFDPKTAYAIWFTLLMIYGFVASVTPVWILLQPRDYISSWVLIIGVALAFAGIFVVSPEMNAPFIATVYSESQGPIIPFLFIIIACGAVSGFHSLIASGTSSKQIDKESDALFVGFGGMLVETIIGIICVIIAGGAIVWGTESGQLQEIFKSGGALAVYGTGFGKLTSFIFGSDVGSVIGITIVKIFIMTTLDTSVRLSRFLTNEMIGGILPKPLKNKFSYTIIPIIPAFILGVTDSWASIWPVFGAANQLVAALVFIILTSYLYSKGKPVKYTIYATVFMLLMTISALLWMVWKFFFAKPDFLLGTVSAILIILAIMMVIEGVKKIRISRS
ncbi:MAG TPA: carbon starvation CstA family protein [bacterium]|nr:carbon starvation CstA family protein [bacterium]